MKKQNFLVNQRGIAMVEMLPLLFIFVILFGLTFGLWASIHTGMLQSIAARHYAFQVLNNRTHFIYHRDTSKPNNKETYYGKDRKRFFAIIEGYTGDDPKLVGQKSTINLFNKGVLNVSEHSGDSGQSNPILLKTGYGICLDFKCEEKANIWKD